MAYKSLAHFIQVLEQGGELVRIKEYVNPHLEITEITDRISKQYGPALLFENTGYYSSANTRETLLQREKDYLADEKRNLELMIEKEEGINEQ